MSTKKINLLFAFLIATLVFACGGGDGGGGSDTGGSNTGGSNTQDQDESKLCGSVVQYQGFKIVTRDFDLDGDGCLSQTELDQALAYNDDVNNRTLAAQVINNDFPNTFITDAKIVGNSEVLNGRAQIYSNLLEGKFQITLSSSSFREEGDYIFIGFSNGTAKQYLSGEEGIRLSKGLRFNEDVFFGTTLECQHTGSFEFICTDATGAVITLDNSDIFDSLPVNAYLNVFVCGDNGCYDNHASIPVSLIN